MEKNQQNHWNWHKTYPFFWKKKHFFLLTESGDKRKLRTGLLNCMRFNSSYVSNDHKHIVASWLPDTSTSLVELIARQTTGPRWWSIFITFIYLPFTLQWKKNGGKIKNIVIDAFGHFSIIKRKIYSIADSFFFFFYSPLVVWFQLILSQVWKWDFFPQFFNSYSIIQLLLFRENKNNTKSC